MNTFRPRIDCRQPTLKQPTENMAQEDYSRFTFEQLRERLDSLILRLKYNLAREMPVTSLYVEIKRTITSLDRLMEEYRDTIAYDQYQQEREALSAMLIPIQESAALKRR